MQLSKTVSISSRSAGRPATVARPALRARSVVVRAAEENKESTVFYGGKTYTESEFNVAKSNGTIPQAPPAEPKPQVGFGDVMAFSGIGPETINGRLAMLGFVAAVSAELSSGEPVLTQWAQEPFLIFATFALIIAGSLVPFLQGNKNKEAFGPLSPSAELLNGRAAMIGFAAMLVLEAVNGRPLI